MDARLRILRVRRISDQGRYTIVLDEAEVGMVARGKSTEMEVAPGAHTLRLVSSLGRSSPVVTFNVLAGETAAFSCLAPSLIAALSRAVTAGLLSRGSWIALDRAGHHAGGGDEGSALDSSEQNRELVKTIQAAQANQPGLRR
jgi:hypothetical protein